MTTLHSSGGPPGQRPDLAKPPDEHAEQESEVAVTLPSRLALAAGAWLLIAPFALAYSTTGHGFRAYWNDVAVGIVVIALAALRIAQPRGTAALATLSAMCGGWLVVAPYTLDFATKSGAPRAAVNDTVVGVLLVLLAASSSILDRRLSGSAGS